MKLTKLFTLLIVIFATGFLMAGCGNQVTKGVGGDGIKVVTDENVAVDAGTQTKPQAEEEIAADLNDGAIDEEIELGELI